MLAPADPILIDAVAPRSGERILDIGCGTGAVSELLALEGAAVTGIDLSETMIAGAQFRARENLSFQVADAAQFLGDAPFAAVASRFGVMFFDDPHAAFANIRANLVPDGRLVFLCWQAPDRNPWAMVPAKAVVPLLAEPMPTDPDAPGPFALADSDRIMTILDAAGFRDAVIEGHDVPIVLSRDGLDDATDFACQIGPGSRALTELDETGRAKARIAIREALSGHVGPTGSLTMAGAVWLVTARA
ncbi:MAG: class I SAM-dependent methyltransferase [Parasphingopyxis sp.]|uniref:class I SAM-dependent methyltransferase n=1 Tax=Parasphingopyxis sp. TaxID=1920299 RepID=UPI003F9FD257